MKVVVGLYICIISICFGICGAQLSLEKIYGVWHCGDDQCSWAIPTNLSNSQWIINRGDGKPTANVVILSFVNPLDLLQQTNNQQVKNGIPVGFTSQVLSFFKNAGITLLFSIGGAAYSNLWDQALSSDSTQLAKNAAAAAQQYGVGIEIDYENDNGQSLDALDNFVKVYRSIIPFNDSPTPPAESLITVDLGAGTGYLTGISQHASGWLNSSLANWANAMVSCSPWPNVQAASPYWLEHLDGTHWAGIPAMEPSQLLVSNYVSSDAPNCATYSGTVLEGTITWVNNYTTRGLMFWSAGCPGPNNCAINCAGLQQGSEVFLN